MLFKKSESLQQRVKIRCFKKSFTNMSDLTDVLISTTERHGAGAKDTLLWANIDALVTKMLRLKCPVENLSEIYIIILFTHFCALLNKKKYIFAFGRH